MTDSTKGKIAVVGLPGKWSTEVLADALQARTGFRLVVDMREVVLDLQNKSLYYREHNLCEFDGIIVKKISAEYSPNTLDRLELLRVAEAQGVPVFSQAQSILRLIDRLSCTVTLRNHDIPMPATVITESVDQALHTVDKFGAAVFKPLYSTKARGMEIIRAEDADKKSAVERFSSTHPCMYIQQKLNLSGRDLGMVFLGGQYLGSYARLGAGDSWNTTIHSGGKYAKAEPEPELIDLATRAQAPFAMDFTTVDVAETDNGPIVFEVSAFGGFRGAKDGIGIDAAALYADYVLEKLNG
ncbi:GAK system ATP-grasp enzyme [Gilvimarinus sp. DA14]|uniref:GAK system ATP-grasp enzyme n=1 Tax=Gilvimarinus sp. DA14 TaxID=2956798 RepID=UPI0020B6E56B|nr:GAK system ATP-grasp enzyme [Gilvimarinus sp. DA14]UTF59904.1 GAK system ATP-grasp enzyme [Gilvimarinus sp. DA14]